MIFVTVGSQKFQFNRLLRKIDEMVARGQISEPVFAQIGASDYLPENYQYATFLDRDAFSEKIDECDTVITHGGTGVIINAVKRGKRVVAVPRLAQYGEHVDDHQVQLLQQFDEANLIISCYEIDKLPECYARLEATSFCSYLSNTQVIIDSIDEYLTGIIRE